MTDETLPILPSPGLGSPLLEVKYRHWLALLCILLLGTFLRLFQLDAIPPGFHYDEAFNALQARDVVSGANRPIFFTGNFGEEPMQMYVEAVVFALAGQSPWSARFSDVILGLLLIPSLYFCARAFFPHLKLIALAAAFIGATLYWAINFSRIAIETNSLPWVLTLSAGSLAMAHATRDSKWGAASGILFGTTLYTYLASRAYPLVVLLWFAYLVVFHRNELRPRLRTWFVMALFAALTVAPLALFFWANPLALTGRSGQVLTIDQMGTNLARSAAMFFFVGDTDPRDNLPGRPALDFFLAVLFLIGLIVTIARAKKPTYAFLLIWLVVMTLPSAVTEFAPNFRRAIGALPAVAIVCSVGVDWLWSLTQPSTVRDRRETRWYGQRLMSAAKRPSLLTTRVVLRLLLTFGFAYSAWSSVGDYFHAWGASSGLYYSFDAGLLQVAQTLVERPAGEQICVSPDYHDHPTVLWAMNGRAYSAFDGRRVAVLPNSALPATCAIITYEDQTFSIAHFFPGAQRLATINDFEGKPYAQVFYIPAGTLPKISPQHRLDARVGDAVRVLGYDLTREGERIDLQVYWRAERAMPEDYTVFVHLIGPQNPTTASPVWAQDDAQPGHGTFPTSRWLAGETIIDRYAIRLPTGAPPAAYHFEIGMYLLSTGGRLPVWVDGQREAEDRLLLGGITE
jgi:hypothetical protein